MRAKDAVGRYGEKVAVGHLVRSGLAVLDRNWRCELGELDVVAREGTALVAVEVKTRRCGADLVAGAGHPLEAITPAKAARLRRLLVAWAAAHDVRAPELRVDAVAVLRPPAGAARVEHLRGVA